MATLRLEPVTVRVFSEQAHDFASDDPELSFPSISSERELCSLRPTLTPSPQARASENSSGAIVVPSELARPPVVPEFGWYAYVVPRLPPRVTWQRALRFFAELLVVVVLHVLLCAPYLYAVTRTYHVDRSTQVITMRPPLAHLTMLVNIVLASVIPWFNLILCWGFDRRRSLCMLLLVALGALSHAVSYPLRWSLLALSLWTQGVIALGIPGTSYYFWKYNGCSLKQVYWRYLFPSSCFLLVTVTYDLFFVKVFLNGSAALQLAMRMAIHPLLFYVPARLLFVNLVKWEVPPEHPLAQTGVVSMCIAIKLFYGRFFAFNLESLRGVAISSAAITGGELVYRFLYPWRNRLYRRALGPQHNAPLRQALTRQALLYERIHELSFILLAYICIRYYDLVIGPMDTKRALESMAIQLAFEVAGDVVAFGYELWWLRLPLIEEWDLAKRRLGLWSLYNLLMVTSIFWMRCSLLLSGHTIAEAHFAPAD